MICLRMTQQEPHTKYDPRRATAYRCLLALALAFGNCGGVAAHPGSINLFVNAQNQIFPLENFPLPQLVMYLGTEISIDGPGFGVNFPANGVLPDTFLRVDVVHDLMFWDGVALAPTSVTFEMRAPLFDNQGVVNMSPVSSYFIDSDSGFQTGMTWGTYNGTLFWEAHALNFILPLDAPSGIYGTVLRFHASQHESSNAFVVPFVYDNQNLWTDAEEQVGVARMRQATAALQVVDLNQDGHVNTDDLDLLVAEIAAGTNNSTFDLTGEGLVDQDDRDEWLFQGGVAKLPSASAYLPGDANLDGVVDGQDFIAWNSAKFTSTAAWSQGDFNADGVTDGQDFIIWNQHKFSSSLLRSTLVPEPMSAFLTLILTLTVCCFARGK